MVEGSIRNIINIIENPEQTTDQELSYLFNLSIKHPYSGFCHLIIAKTLHKQNRTGFNNVLRKAALTNVDRSILHKYIHQDEKKEANKNLENKHVTLPTDEDEQFLEKNVISNLIENQLTEELENIEENQVEKTNIAPLPTVDENTVMRFEDWLTKNKQKSNSKQQRTVNEIIKSLENRQQQKDKADFFTASEAAKKSILDNEDLNTETLAEVYIKQGNYPKAIKIYEQLMLINPEKKAFFASQINFINKKTKI